jgi:hypothetical protein
MRWYLLREAEVTGYNSVEGSLGSLSESDLRKGTRVGRLEGAWVMAQPRTDGIPDDFLANHFALPIVSRRLQEAMLGASMMRDVEFLPIRVLHSDCREEPGYAILNVLSVVDVFDLALSSYELFGDDYFISQKRGKIRSMNSPVLRCRTLEGHHVLRPAGFEVQIYCSGSFRRIVEDLGLTGAQLLPIPVVESSSALR